jgi:molybdenum cofactor cytidylyltransferase
VLAAGEGSRFGSPKQVALVEGEPLVVRAVRAALASGAQRVLVVTGAHADAVGAALQGQVHAGVTLVHNPGWASGQASSLRAGLGALRPEESALLCLPVDQPYLDPALLRRLAQAWRQGADVAAPLADGVLRGAPALFDRRLFPELHRIQGDTGGRAVLAAHRAAVAAVAAPAAMLRDVDLPGDLPAS